MRVSIPNEKYFESFKFFCEEFYGKFDYNENEYIKAKKAARTMRGKDQEIEVWYIDDDAVIGVGKILPTLSIDAIEYGGNLSIDIFNRSMFLEEAIDVSIKFIKSFYPIERMLFTVKDDDYDLLLIMKEKSAKSLSEGEVTRDGESFNVKRFNLKI